MSTVNSTSRPPAVAVAPASPVFAPWFRLLVALATAAILASFLTAIATPLWLSACLGGVAGLRVAAPHPGRARRG